MRHGFCTGRHLMGYAIVDSAGPNTQDVWGRAVPPFFPASKDPSPRHLLRCLWGVSGRCAPHGWDPDGPFAPDQKFPLNEPRLDLDQGTAGSPALNRINKSMRDGLKLSKMQPIAKTLTDTDLFLTSRCKPRRRDNVKMFLLASAMSVAFLSSAHATSYRFFCTNQSDPAVNPQHDGVFVAITDGTAQSFDVTHSISGRLYSRRVQYRVTSITQPATDSYFWEGFMLQDPHVIMKGHLWQNEGVWMYTENQRFTDRRPPKLATPPVVCHNTGDVRQAVDKDEQHTVPPGSEPSNPQPRYTPPPPPSPQYSQTSLPDCSDSEVILIIKKLTSNRVVGSVSSSFVDMITVDQTQGMGINNNNGSKYCRALFSCDMNVAREAEKGVYGQHPLQAACYRYNEAASSGNPAWVQFELKPSGSGGWLATIMQTN
jgi:hypothetical protein